MIPPNLEPNIVPQDLEQQSGYDIWLLFLTILLCVIGAIFVLTSSAMHSWQGHLGSMSAIFQNHLTKMAMGLCAMTAAAFVNYRVLEKLARPAVLVSLALLIVVLYVPQPPKINANRFITILGFSFQPSELAKFALISYFAARMAEHFRDPFATNRNQIYKGFLVILALMVWLIYEEPNLSMVMLFIGISGVLLMLSGIPIRILLIAGPGVGVLSVLAAWLTGYQRDRITAYVDGILNPLNSSYHVFQSFVGIGHGGVTGVGLGESTQKHFFLPEPYKDFIFAIVGEELGFAGSIAMLVLFALLLWRCWRIARLCREPFGYYLAAGITASFAISVVVNLGVTLGLLPATGQPLPFISFGGTSMIVSLAAIGVLLNISRHVQKQTATESQDGHI